MKTLKIKRPVTIVRVAAAALLLVLIAVLGIAMSPFRAQPAVAATASTVNFQAKLMASSGSIVGDGTYNAEFKLYSALTSSGSSQGSCTGDAACLWTETRTTTNRVTVVNGYLTVELGSVTALPTSIDWSQNLYLSMRIGGTAVSPAWDPEMSPRLHLTATPYAFAAGSLGGLSASQFVQLAPNVVQADTSTNSSIFINKTGASGNLLQLQQNGANLLAVGYGGATTIKTSTNATSGFLVQDASNNPVLNVDTTNRRIGIGTATPAESLHIHDTGSFAVVKMTTTNTGTTLADGSVFAVENSTSNFQIVNKEAAAIQLFTSNTERVRITSAGNLGIGTTTPQAKLHVGATTETGFTAGASINAPYNALTTVSNAGTLYVSTTDTATQGYGGSIAFGGAYNTTSQYTKFAAIQGAKENGTAGDYAGYLGFYTRINGSSLAENMRIDSSGKVGIGTTGPGYKLDVAGDINISTGSVYRINGTSICTSSGCLAASGSANYIQNQNASDQTANMRITGTVRANTSVQTPLLDTATAVALNVGTTNATSINLNKATNITGNTAITGTLSTTGAVSTTAGGSNGVGSQLLASNAYVQSRGQNLVANGSGLLGNNYNFSGFTFDPIETSGGGGSFRINVSQQSRLNDELIPVDPLQKYTLSGYAKSGDTGGANFNAANRQYFGLMVTDIDGFNIDPSTYAKVPGSTDTTLAAPLNPGDTTVTLTNATGWYNGSTISSTQFAWYGYTNSKGYTYPDYTYTRNLSGSYGTNSASGTWLAGGISGNVITLRAPWAGPALASGAAIRNNQYGGTYKYLAASNAIVPNAWTNYSGTIGGIDVNGTQSTNLFPYGTAYVRLLFLINYHAAADNNIRWSNISLTGLTAQNMEVATTTVQGVVSTTTQTLGGNKTFQGSANSWNLLGSNGTISAGIYNGTIGGFTGGIIGTSTNNALGLTTNGATPQAVLLTSGNFGIGTLTPSALLSVGSSSQFQVSSAGAITGVGMNAGTGLVQGTGGVTISGAVNQLYVSGATNASVSTNTNWIRAPKNAVSIYVGDNDSTTAYSSNESAGDIRFNGTGVNHGDFGYYPQGGSSYGNFRMSITGTTIDPVPDARLGVGSLYAATGVTIGSTTQAGMLSVGSSNQFQVSSAGAVTAVGVNAGAGLLQGALGLTVTGATASLNASSNFATNINTGTSSGTVTVGGGSAPLVIDSTAFDVTSAGAVSGVTTLATSGAINGQTISSTANFTGTVTVQGGSGLALGVSSSSTGLINFRGSGGASTISLIGQVNPTINRTITLPDETGVVCLQGSVNCGFMTGSASSYIQNQNAGQQATSNFWISGAGRADTSTLTPLLDTATAVALNVGTTNATSINLNKNTTVASGKTLTVNGEAVFQPSNSATAFRILNAGSTSGMIVDTTGNIFEIDDLEFYVHVNSTGALDISDASGNSLLTADTVNGEVNIGAAYQGALLILSRRSTAGDPANGADGAMYYSTNMGDFRCYRGGYWASCSAPGIDRTFMVQDEFLGGTTSASQIGELGWSPLTYGAGTSVVAFNTGTLAPTAAHPGIVRLKPNDTGGSSNSVMSIALNSNSGTADSLALAAGNTVRATAAVGSAASSTQTFRVGLYDQSDLRNTNNTGVWWEADPTSNSNWRYCYVNGSATTVCASSSTAIAANTFARLAIKVNSLGSGTSSVTFTINGTDNTVSGVTVDSGTLVNNTVGCLAQTTTSRDCYVDYYQFTGVVTTPR